MVGWQMKHSISTEWIICTVLAVRGEGNLRPRRFPRKYLGEYTSRGKPKIPPADRILIDLSQKASKNPSDNADLGFQACV